VTLIDEETLRSALCDAAGAFSISDEAMARILATAERDEAPPRKNLVPLFVRQPGRPRTLLAAAAILVVLSGITVPLVRGEHQTARVSTNAQGTVHGDASKSLSPGGSSLAERSPTYALLPAPEAGQLTGTGFRASTSQKIESTGSVSVTVPHGHVESTFAKLSALATQLHGQVESTQANSSAHSSSSFASGTIVLEVPQSTFTRFVTEVEHVGHATSVTTSSNNVTGQYVDLQARIGALNASLAQYLKIMTKATTVTGILAVQDQINSIQSEIEQDQGQLKLLNNEATYASLSVTVAQTGHHALTTRSGFSKAWRDSLHGFVEGFEWLVRLAGPALFALLLLGVLYEIVKYSRRAIRRRRI
jgi:hypothetical protein